MSQTSPRWPSFTIIRARASWREQHAGSVGGFAPSSFGDSDPIKFSAESMAHRAGCIGPTLGLDPAEEENAAGGREGKRVTGTGWRGKCLGTRYFPCMGQEGRRRCSCAHVLHQGLGAISRRVERAHLGPLAQLRFRCRPTVQSRRCAPPPNKNHFSSVPTYRRQIS